MYNSRCCYLCLNPHLQFDDNDSIDTYVHRVNMKYPYTLISASGRLWKYVFTLISAPERSSLAVMYSSRSRSSESVIFFVWIWKILLRVFSSGRGNSIFRSIRPKSGQSHVAKIHYIHVCTCIAAKLYHGLVTVATNQSIEQKYQHYNLFQKCRCIVH